MGDVAECHACHEQIRMELQAADDRWWALEARLERAEEEVLSAHAAALQGWFGPQPVDLQTLSDGSLRSKVRSRIHQQLLAPLAARLRRQVDLPGPQLTREEEDTSVQGHVLDELLDRWETEVDALVGEAGAAEERLARRARRRAKFGQAAEAPVQAESKQRIAAWAPVSGALESLKEPIQRLSTFFQSDVSEEALERLASIVPLVAARAVCDFHFQGYACEFEQLEAWWDGAKAALQRRDGLWQQLLQEEGLFVRRTERGIEALRAAGHRYQAFADFGAGQEVSAMAIGAKPVPQQGWPAEAVTLLASAISDFRKRLRPIRDCAAWRVVEAAKSIHHRLRAESPPMEQQQWGRIPREDGVRALMKALEGTGGDGSLPLSGLRRRRWDPSLFPGMSSADQNSASASQAAEEKPGKATSEPQAERQLSWAAVAGCILGALVALYIFLVGLQLLGDAFKCLGGKGAGSMFTAIKNPIAGLMTGILATVLVQSSSTSTSIVVGLVGADQITVKTGIPIIMGANIGTSVTNTIVSMGHVGDRLELQRAFSGATVHDMFNYLTVLTLLPIEAIIGAIQGEGGPLYWLTNAITDGVMGGDEGGELFDSPIKLITKPVAKEVISNNKYVINALSLGVPVKIPTTAGDINQTNCDADFRRLTAVAADAEAVDMEADARQSRALLSRRLTAGDVGCAQYYCISKTLSKELSKLSSKNYLKVQNCSGYIRQASCTSDQKCHLDVGNFYDERVNNGRIIKGGFVEGAGDVGGGIIALIIALLLLTGGLFALTKCLHMLFMGKARRVIARATRMNDYIALVIGIGMTIIVQSSSVVTSALTPFCGMGVLSLDKMLPLTLGANIGTTVTALIAALAAFKHSTIHIALCHLFFNIIGILIWFPVPIMRKVPLGAARLLGLYASFYRFVPGLYILVCFVAIPGLALAISALFDASVAGGVIVLLLVLAAFGGFEFWWIWKEGCYRVISKEDREKGTEECEAAQNHILGLDAEQGASI